MRYLKIVFAVLFAAAVSGCVYEFHPDMEQIEVEDLSALVVEGDIAVGGETVVKLSFTAPLESEVQQDNYLFMRSSVWVESNEGEVWYGEQNPARMSEFRVDTRELDQSGTYRLCVSVPGRGEYVSEFRECLVTPQIKRLEYSVPQDSTCMYVNVSGHKGMEEIGYYKWSYVETWIGRPDIMPELKYMGGDELAYMSEREWENMHNCYNSAASSDILVASTEALQENVILNHRLVAIGSQDSRISKNYLITVTQSAIDAAGFNYWENMKKNTTGTGGLFAPQPSEVRGNIVSTTNADEQVIGYINVSSVSTATIVIDGGELGLYDSSICFGSTRIYTQGAWRRAYQEGMRPVAYLKNENGMDILTEARWAPASCTSVEGCMPKPHYWPEN